MGTDEVCYAERNGPATVALNMPAAQLNSMSTPTRS